MNDRQIAKAHREETDRLQMRIIELESELKAANERSELAFGRGYNAGRAYERSLHLLDKPMQEPSTSAERSE